LRFRVLCFKFDNGLVYKDVIENAYSTAGHVGPVVPSASSASSTSLAPPQQDAWQQSTEYRRMNASGDILAQLPDPGPIYIRLMRLF
jgi:hypothetical protein